MVLVRQVEQKRVFGTTAESKVLDNCTWMHSELFTIEVLENHSVRLEGYSLKYFSYFSMKTYVVGTHYKCLIDVISLSLSEFAHRNLIVKTVLCRMLLNLSGPVPKPFESYWEKMPIYHVIMYSFWKHQISIQTQQGQYYLLEDKIRGSVCLQMTSEDSVQICCLDRAFVIQTTGSTF